MNELQTITVIRELSQFLSRDGLSAADVIARIGSAVDEPGESMPVQIRPAIAGVDAASLARYPETGLPYLLQMEFAPEARPSVKDLEQAFGEFHRGHTDLEAPVTISFSPRSTGTHWRVVMVAVLAQVNGRLEAAPAQRVMLRRDPI